MILIKTISLLQSASIIKTDAEKIYVGGGDYFNVYNKNTFLFEYTFSLIGRVLSDIIIDEHHIYLIANDLGGKGMIHKMKKGTYEIDDEVTGIDGKILTSQMNNGSIYLGTREGLIIKYDMTLEQYYVFGLPNQRPVLALYFRSVELEPPTLLKQEVKSPYMEKQEVKLSEKIGKFQSGSGIILSANVGNTSGNKQKLDFEVYKLGGTTPVYTSSTGTLNSGIGTITVPFLGAGDYFWKIRATDESGKSSEWINYENDYPWEYDFSRYDGFEPYPYGYRFYNRGIKDNLLSGGIEYFGDNRVRINGDKWNIFYRAFDTSNLENNTNKLFDAFESIGLNSKDEFKGGNCYGMVLSSAMQYSHTGFLQNYYPNFSNQIGEGYIRDKIESPSTTIDGDWDIKNNVLETILSFQLSRLSVHNIKAIVNGITNPKDIVTELENNPDKTYVIMFMGKEKTGVFSEQMVSHIVVPYKVEKINGKDRIYIWDNNMQYPSRFINDQKEYSYNQYIEVNSDGTWGVPYYSLYQDRTSFTNISLVNFDKIYNNGVKTAPRGFNENDVSYSLSGSSDLVIVDSNGKISGFSGGTILEEIPGVHIIAPMQDTLSGEVENNFKQIYIPEKIEGLTINISGKENESYDFMIAGGNYYTKISGINTSSGQTDTYTSTNTGISINFDDNKTGDYSLLTDNFVDTQTGTIFLSGITVNTEPQKYSYDWNKVKINSTDSITYKIDTDNDGNYDIESYFRAVPKIINEKGSISGYVKSTPSNAGWKICIDINNNGTCEENKEPFQVTNNTGYYEFANLEKGVYNVLEIPKNNWEVISPKFKRYSLTLNSGQRFKNINFENKKINGK